MTHSGDGTAPSAVAHEPFRIELRGETMELSDEEARQVFQSLTRQSLARTETEENEARAAGQVWYVTFRHYGAPDEEEYFSLREAAEAMQYANERGDSWPEKVRCPDGTVYTHKDLPDGYTWTLLPALTESPEDQS